MEIGDTVTVNDYTFRFDGVTDVTGPNYTASRGLIRVFRGDYEMMVMHPEKRIYTVQTMPMTEAAIDTSIWRDLYVSLGEPVDGGAWIVRVYYKPFVVWIWIGAIFMALGGLLAVSDRRYRVPVRKDAKAKAADSVPAKPVVTATENS